MREQREDDEEGERRRRRGRKGEACVQNPQRFCNKCIDDNKNKNIKREKRRVSVLNN